MATMLGINIGMQITGYTLEQYTHPIYQVLIIILILSLIIEMQSLSSNQIAAISLALLLVNITAISIETYVRIAKEQALSYGMEDTVWEKASLSDIIKTNKTYKTYNIIKKEQYDPDENGTIIVFYRYGCNDCEFAFEQLQSYTDLLQYIQYVPVPSNNRKLTDTLATIKTVPTIRYKYDNTIIQEPLVINNDGISLNTTVLERIRKEMNNEQTQTKNQTTKTNTTKGTKSQ